MLSRRAFLKNSTLIALAPTVPGFLAQTVRAGKPDRDGRVLVVIELDGGNDGINTVVPYADEGYAKSRKVLRVPAKEILKINDTVGLHPAMKDAAKLLEINRLAIVQGVGYPNPNRSHGRSMAIWQTARFDPEEHNDLGWIGRAMDGAPVPGGGAPASLFVGTDTPPLAIRGRRSVATALDRLDDLALSRRAVKAPVGSLDKDDVAAFIRRTTLDAYAADDRLHEIVRAGDKGVRYPESELAERLRLIARLVKSGFGARVYYTSHGYYDTHNSQLATHALLLGEFSAALRAFLDDLEKARLGDRVAVLIFSEFGRTIKENVSAGTDHGTAAPVFLAGAKVKSGLVGTTPKLLDPDPKHGDLKVGIDFRRVYATVLESWLGISPKSTLGGDFERLPLFRT
jgi:uncharacterized protein (DUF1501 family)